MSFKVGDRVVYPHHGAAVIEKKEMIEFAGEKREYLILRIAHGDMTLSVPTDKADEVGMRPPISAEDVDDLFQLLGKKDVREPTNWSRRFKNHQEKLKSGDVYQVAEVVRNLALREATKGLSAGEKAMLVKARRRARLGAELRAQPLRGRRAQEARRAAHLTDPTSPAYLARAIRVTTGISRRGSRSTSSNNRAATLRRCDRPRGPCWATSRCSTSAAATAAISPRSGSVRTVAA